MSDIRTPEDEIDRPGYFLPPFHEGWWYQGVTYGGHSDFSVDWNRRTKNGGFLQDLGDAVLAAAAGTVSELDPTTGTVYVNHFGGLWRTEYRHMRVIKVKVGDKVQRGDLLGEIGAEGIDPAQVPGGVPSPHLHHVHWKRDRTSDPFRRTKQRFYGEPVEASVGDSDSRPAGTDLPGPVMLQGPPTRATWESAFREAATALGKAEARVAVLTTERDAARTDLATAQARIAELEATPPGDCTGQVNAVLDDIAARTEELRP